MLSGLKVLPLNKRSSSFSPPVLKPKAKVACKGIDAGNASAKVSRCVMLPNAMWLLDFLEDQYYNVHGDNFVIHRTETELMRTPAARKTSQLINLAFKTRSHEMVLYEREANATDKEDYAHSDKSYLLSAGEEVCFALVARPAAPTGIVWSGTEDAGIREGDCNGDEEVFETETSSPRRTCKIKFTCKRCNSVNIKPVNPFAWENGSVFAKCEKCKITHKIIDNLKLFHELSGPVFPTAGAQHLKFNIPDSLKLPLDPFYWQQN